MFVSMCYRSENCWKILIFLDFQTLCMLYFILILVRSELSDRKYVLYLASSHIWSRGAESSSLPRFLTTDPLWSILQKVRTYSNYQIFSCVFLYLFLNFANKSKIMRLVQLLPPISTFLFQEVDHRLFKLSLSLILLLLFFFFLQAPWKIRRILKFSARLAKRKMASNILDPWWRYNSVLVHIGTCSIVLFCCFKPTLNDNTIFFRLKKMWKIGCSTN